MLAADEVGRESGASSAASVFCRQGERLNYALPAPRDPQPACRRVDVPRKFSRALQHVRLYEEHGPGTPLAEATFYEFGAGWDLAIPLSYAALGVPAAGARRHPAQSSASSS